MLPEINSYALVGGEKADYASAEDTSTDRSAVEINEAFADATAATRTAIRAYIVFTVSGGVCTVVEHESVWGHDVSVLPTVQYAGVGQYQVTWPASVTDARGIVHLLRLRRGWANIQSLYYYGTVVPAMDPNKMAVNVETGGAPADPAGAVVMFVL